MVGTLADLANQIQVNGGKVVSVVALVNDRRNRMCKPRRNHVRLIKGRSDETRTGALTADEAQYLANYGDVDELRESIASARSKRDKCLHAKGVRSSTPDDEVSLQRRTDEYL